MYTCIQKGTELAETSITTFTNLAFKLAFKKWVYIENVLSVSLAAEWAVEGNLMNCLKWCHLGQHKFEKMNEILLVLPNV